MSRIQQIFSNQKKVLIPYITAGDPKPEFTVTLMHALVAGGADIIELGMPFSDPTADGVVIQKAHERALKAGTTLNHIFAMVREFRLQNNKTPIVLMGYINPIEMLGQQKFIAKITNAGVDGVLIVDMPAEEGADFFKQMKTSNIDPIFLTTATTSPERLKNICAQASGFLYYVSLKGVTGASNLDFGTIKQKVAALRKLSDISIAVGFGVRDATTAKQIADIADGVVIGSALVSLIEKHQHDLASMQKALIEFLSEVKSRLKVSPCKLSVNELNKES